MKNINKLALVTAIAAISSASISSTALAAESTDTVVTKKEIKQQIRANKKKIKQLKAELKETNEKRLKRALRLAKKNNWELRKQLQDGRIIELVDVDDFDQPVYFTTYNSTAADTINTDDVWPTGKAQLALTGKDVTVGVWDGGAVRTTHREFNNALITDEDGITTQQTTKPRAIQQDQNPDLSNPLPISNHATHVAGTIAAGGVWDEARGMANQATVHAYDWNNDDAEMLSEAEGGLLLSNHSYGFITGWNYRDGRWQWTGNDRVSRTEDYRFGFYSSSSAGWDDIAEAAPHYLIVKAAGNDRGDGPRNRRRNQPPRDCEATGFDCIGSQGIAKNILTIGAVEDIVGGYTQASDVVAASFTSFGPADDGRIKPDLVANGVGVLSAHGTEADDRYYRISGTSMATPSVTGSLALLQEHYEDENDFNMLAATLKGLAIHTASEAGSSEGPDYRFGWGLMNTSKATEVISNATRDADSGQITDSIIFELSALNEKTLTIDLVPDDVGSALSATIVWSDPAATPFNTVDTVLNNRTARLINDLDMVIIETNSNGDEIKHQPYKLDPANPSSAAEKADNDVDNIEKVFISNPVADSSYQLQVAFDDDHSEDNTVESFSLIASNVKTPSCFVPRDLEVNENRTSHNRIVVTWDTPRNTDGDVYISYRVEGTENWQEKRVDNNRSSTRLTQLQASTDYEIRARFECGGDSNLYSTVITEETNAAPAP